MKKFITTVITTLISLFVLAAAETDTIMFPNQPSMDTYNWLIKNGFVLKNGAEDKSKFELSFSSKGLVLKALRPGLGLLVKENLRIEHYRKLIVKWGIESYPTGANWDKKVHNEPLMVYVFFGTDRYSSDSWFIPNSPAFIGFYLGEHDQIGKMRTGRHFTTGGRYVCVANPPAGKMITSEIDLVDAFKKAFGDKLPMPSFISGISIECDTSDLARNITSSAFVSSLEVSQQQP